MENNSGFFRWLIITFFSYVIGSYGLCLLKPEWSFSGDLITELVFIGKMALMAYLYLSCLSLQGRNDFIGRLEMAGLIVLGGAYCYTIYQHSKGLQLNSFGFSDIKSNLLITAAALGAVALATHAMGVFKTSETASPFSRFNKE